MKANGIMNTIIAILLIFFAGIMNGSFALPTKYVPKWKFENIWLNFAIWAFILLPWSVALYSEPRIFQIYAQAPLDLYLATIICSMIFGIGQICFATAIKMIGMGLAFTINLGIGIGLGFALPLIVQYPQKIPTLFGCITLTGTALSIIGLIIASYAGILRDRYRNTKTPLLQSSKTKQPSGIGTILAIIAGLGSASQNFVFSYTQSLQSLALDMGANHFAATNIIWPGFLLCAVIPYLLYMLYLHYKNSSFSAYRQPHIGNYYFLTIMMSVFSYGSLLIYSKAAQLIGDLGPVIGWPIFMTLIILVSNFWSWRYREWQNCGKQAENMMKIGIVFLSIAVTILGYSPIIH